MTGDAEAPGKDAAGVLRKQKHYNDSDSLEPDRLSVAVVDDRDHMSSASDDDGSRALQVSFDESNPYRRKSSMVSSGMDQNKKTRCFVHQFLDGHRRQAGQASQASQLSVCHEDRQERVAPSQGPGDNQTPPTVEPDSADSTDAGQIDEKAWTTTINKTKSELDLLHSDQHGELHSRLLTKKQLSEMAWGVRELSRRLGNLRLRFKARTIFILTKIYDPELVPKTREVTKWLLGHERDVRYTVYIEHSLKENNKFDAKGLLAELRQEYIDAGELESDAPTDALDRRIRYWDENVCRARPHTFDFIITLGGDGTVLYASWLFQRIVPPVLSFALGSLGFLTKFDFADYQNILSTSFKDGVTVSLRLRFEGTVMRTRQKEQAMVRGGPNDDHVPKKRDLVEELIGEEQDNEYTHQPDGTYEILNEIVVDRGPNATLSYIEIFGDDEHFTSVLADGVCVSTPTGSTAYNLAADTIVLRVGVPYDARTNSWASFDGRERVELFPGDYVTISASRFPFASVMPLGRRSEDWVNSISGKLGWNTRQKQKNDGYKAWEV